MMVGDYAPVLQSLMRKPTYGQGEVFGVDLWKSFPGVSDTEVVFEFMTVKELVEWFGEMKSGVKESQAELLAYIGQSEQFPGELD